MKKTLLTTFCALIAAMSLNVNAELVITYTGTLSYEGAPSGQEAGFDFAGLDGASFTFTGTFDETATRFFTNGNGYDEFLGVTSLSIVNSPSGIDGVYSPEYNTFGESTNGTLDSYAMPSYVVQDFTLFLHTLEVENGFTGASSPTNTLTPFTTSDLISNFAYVTVVRPGDSDANYSVSNITVTNNVSVPTAMGLFGMGALSLYGLVRRRKLK
jgi:hypothetical protein